MIVSAIAAVSRNFVIGNKGSLPWHLPADMRYFKTTTLNRHIIMGRKSFDSLGKPLPKRTNIVVTRNPSFFSSGCIITHSIEEALKIAHSNKESEVFIIGGGEIYLQSMPYLDKIYLTHIDLEAEGDVFFPELDPGLWELKQSDKHRADQKNPFNYTFAVYAEKKALIMKEDFLQFLWKTKRFNHEDLKTTDGQSLSIIQPGIQNFDAGPDFTNALLRIGKTTWAGQVEIHVKASEWYVHNHHKDKTYQNVILHVVYEHNAEVVLDSGTTLPCLVLKERINHILLEKYSLLKENASRIPCANLINLNTNPAFILWLNRLVIERLEQKVNLLKQVFLFNKNDWEETFYHLLCRYFGGRVNDSAFNMLARSLPLKTIAKHRSLPLQVESLFFGQAGFLNASFHDHYPCSLKKEYRFLKKKLGLKPINPAIWKFSRLRPANFPTIRLAQFASLIRIRPFLFRYILETDKLSDLFHLLESKTAAYWDTHYLFDKSSVLRKKKLGKSAIKSLLINAIIPMIFFYGQVKDDISCQEKVLLWLEELDPEKNKITRIWEDLGFSPLSAIDSQALIQLTLNYCLLKKCLYCTIGNELIRG